MGATFSSGYCQPIAVASENVAPVTAYVLALAPVAFVVLALIVSFLLPKNAQEHIRTFVRMLDFYPTLKTSASSENRIVYRTPKTVSGGVLTLMILMVVAITLYFSFVTEVSPRSQTPLVEMDVLQNVGLVPLTFTATLPCPSNENVTVGCNNLTLAISKSDTFTSTTCTESDGNCLIRSQGNYSNEAALSFNLTMPTVYKKLSPTQYYTIQLQADVATLTDEGDYMVRPWDPVSHLRDFLVFTDSCVYLQNIPLGDQIQMTTTAKIRRNCQRTTGPRFACGSNYLSGEYNDGSLGFAPNVAFQSHDPSSSSSSASTIFTVNVDTNNQYSTSLPRSTPTLLGLKMFIQLAAFLALGAIAHPVLRIPVSYIFVQAQVRQNGIAIQRLPAFLAGLAMFSLITLYFTIVFLIFLLCGNSTFKPEVLTYSRSKLGDDLQGLQLDIDVFAALCVVAAVVAVVSFLFALWLRGRFTKLVPLTLSSPMMTEDSKY